MSSSTGSVVPDAPSTVAEDARPAQNGVDALPPRLRTRRGAARSGPWTGRSERRNAVILPAPDEDGLAPFRPAILAIRWGTVGVGLALAYADFQDHPALIAFCGGVLVALTLFRTFRPVRLDRRFVGTVLGLEMALTIAVVCISGAWSSPFAFSLITTVVVAGMARGFISGLAFASAAIITVGAVDMLAEETDTRTAVQWICELVLVALVAGYARRASSASASSSRASP